MCSQKNSKALAPPPRGALLVRRVSSESATSLPHRRDCGIDSSIPKQARTENRSAVPDSRDRPGPSRLRLSEDPGAAEARGLECRQEAGVSAVSRRRVDAALQAATEEMRGNESPGALQANSSQPGVEFRLCGGSTDRRAQGSSFGGRGCGHERKACDRGGGGV